MTLGTRLKLLRKEIGISLEAMGAQGFVSAPGWIKLENGQRQPSDKLIHRLISWMLRDHYVNVHAAGELLEELLTLKYMASPSAFVRRLAYNHAKHLLAGTASLVSDEPAVYRPQPRRNRSDTKQSGEEQRPSPNRD